MPRFAHLAILTMYLKLDGHDNISKYSFYSRFDVTTSEKIFLVWSASLGQTLVMPMRGPPLDGAAAQICSLGEPDHILQVR